MSAKEEQFTRFPTKVLEALMAYRLTPTQMSVFLYVARYTWGWKSRIECKAPVTSIAKKIGRDKWQTGRAVRDLITLGLIEEVDGPTFRHARTVRIRENIEEWEQDLQQLCDDATGAENHTSRGAKIVTSTGADFDTSTGVKNHTLYRYINIESSNRKELKKDPPGEDDVDWDDWEEA